ncbi:Protein of unknown function [Plantibacter flavus]|uniref:DUF3558 domain-containing protein n=1 Tax=Plantibacter flavus TaxID=150123 RepID=A0A3N2BXM9_9MICO|nr:hypothetical protein [Plantibacter flavus]ROR79997.1 hypothetical protein EDD42_0028 [Plantibacter flavus]SMG28305.1 Protein of unknown function [Plantibacter flavus]
MSIPTPFNPWKPETAAQTRRNGPRSKVPSVRGLGLLIAVVGLSACSTSAPVASSGSSSLDAPAADAVSAPVSLLPDISCGSAVNDDHLAALFGKALPAVPADIGDAAVLIEGGLSCRFAAGGQSLDIRVAPNGGDHWANFNSAYAHTEWSTEVGDISGLTCETPGEPTYEGRCELHMRVGDTFVELVAKGSSASHNKPGEALSALAQIVARRVPQPTTQTPPSRKARCEELMDVAEIRRILDAEGPQPWTFAPPTAVAYTLAADSIHRVGGTSCELGVSGKAAAVSYQLVPAGAWVFGAESPLETAQGEPMTFDRGRGILDRSSQPTVHLTDGDHWIRLRIPAGANEAAIPALADLVLGALR